MEKKTTENKNSGYKTTDKDLWKTNYGSRKKEVGQDDPPKGPPTRKPK
ncbi:MAG: hypothetical protein RR595_06620 [Lysinibacillus sp.]